MRNPIATAWLRRALLGVVLSGALLAAATAPKASERSYTRWGKIFGSPKIFEVKCTLSNKTTVIIRSPSTQYSGPLIDGQQEFDGCIDPTDLEAKLKERLGPGIEVFPGSSPPASLSEGPVLVRLGPPAPRQQAQVDRAYIASQFDQSISVLDLDALRITGSVDVAPRLPGGVAVTPDGLFVYTTLWRSTAASPPLPAQVVLLNPEATQILGHIDLGADLLPGAPALSPDGKWLYCTDQTAGLLFINLEAKKLDGILPPPTTTGPAGTFPNAFHAVAVSPDGSLLYIAHSGSLGVVDIRSRTYSLRIPVAPANSDVAPVFDLTGSRVYVVERRSAVENNQSITHVWLVGVDTATASETERIVLPNNFDPDNIALAPDGLELTAYGLVRAPGADAKAVFIVVDLAEKSVVATDESEFSSVVGSFGYFLEP